ncbi:MAG: magnesium/cobalt transporter CorA [Verrucomicrobiales bacterium]|nr:magnesium/cobalt transporter CorA [Verrucomicrobiota bacterium JB025]
MQGTDRHCRSGVRKRSAKAGLSPGTMVFLGEQKVDALCVDVVSYGPDRYSELRDVGVGVCGELAKGPGIDWISVNGIHDVGLIESLGSCFGLHPLTLEDIVNTGLRPKIEEFESYLFATLKMIRFDEAAGAVEMEQVSLIFGENYVVSFQEGGADVFAPVRERLRFGKGRIRSRRADYLAYSLMDAVVDEYFLLVERIGDRIEVLDDKILEDPDPGDLQEVHRLKREILGLRKAVWPLREEIAAMEKSDSELIRGDTRVFLRDLYDHAIHVIDMVETYRDLLTGMHDTYLSSVSNRMNEVMKVLTNIATIFMPLSFIAGMYGMNFENMPGLRQPYGFVVVLAVMLTIGVGMAVYFRRKNWL